jgi:hypothetical protein
MSDAHHEGFLCPRRLRGRFGAALALVAFVTIGLFVSQLWLRDARRNVVTYLQVINDEEIVYVNCQEAEALSATETRRLGGPVRVSLGWLEPDDRITYAVYNQFGRDFTANFYSESNGRRFGTVEIGSLGESREAPIHRFAFVKSFTADRDPIGFAGCKPPDRIDAPTPAFLLSDAFSAERSDGRGGTQFFRPSHAPDWVGWSVARLAWLVGIAGFVLILPLLLYEIGSGGRVALGLLALGTGVITLVNELPGPDSVGEAVKFLGLTSYGIAVTVYLLADRFSDRRWSRSPGERRGQPTASR